MNFFLQDFCKYEKRGKYSGFIMILSKTTNCKWKENLLWNQKNFLYFDKNSFIDGMKLKKNEEKIMNNNDFEKWDEEQWNQRNIKIKKF